VVDRRENMLRRSNHGVAFILWVNLITSLTLVGRARMKRLGRVTLLLSMVAPTVCSAEDRSVDGFWTGNYTYASSVSDGTQPIITDMELKISRDDHCTLSWEGFQTDQKIICAVQKDKSADGIAILFVSYADGSLKNEYGVEIYQPKERLFSLVKSDGKEITTIWSNVYRPDRANKAGRFFVKSD
jgi:hypothetical protein